MSRGGVSKGGVSKGATPKAAPARRAAAKAGAGGPRLAPRHILGLAAAVLTLAVAATLATGGRGAHIAQTVGLGVDRKFADAGFRLKDVHVEGASDMAKPDILRAAGVGEGAPLLGLNLDQLRARVEAVGWVQEARVIRLLPDTLVIAVKERGQLAVWQHGGRTVVIDAQGRVIPEADPARFADLPLVVGAGGAEHAGGILPILVQRPKLMARLEALVRVDNRRWDLRMKDGALVQLPAAEEEQALMKLEQLDLRSRILELGFERIDLRNPDTIAVRPRAPQAAAGFAAGPASSDPSAAASPVPLSPVPRSPVQGV
ncbi:cell division protein FtsQ/DivIB [Phenylobacterium sp.]|uniref:cell division protein FtsQ/DivIB n=1 Tax=Phenylobacterium sp. TaxID=1871053 RepID=UPI00301D7C71